MGLREKFGSDKQKEKEGTWIDIMQNDDGSTCQMKLLRMGGANRAFLKSYTAMKKKFRSNDGIPTDGEIAALIKVFVDTVLIDWKNLEDIRKSEAAFPTVGTELRFMEFSKANAIFVFNELPDLFDLVANEAQKLENFQSKELEDEAKN